MFGPASMSYPPNIFYLVYVSSAVRLFATAELLKILGKFRRNNQLLGISGLLLYKDGNFIQALEGTEETVLIDPSLAVSERGGVPFLAVHVVNADECRFPAGGEPNISCQQFFVDFVP